MAPRPPSTGPPLLASSCWRPEGPPCGADPLLPHPFPGGPAGFWPLALLHQSLALGTRAQFFPPENKCAEKLSHVGVKRTHTVYSVPF